MKKAIFVTLILLLCLSLSACSNKDQSNEKEAEIISATPTSATTTLSYIENIEIKSSPDKYTWYIKNYVGKNAASIGYISLGGDRLDTKIFKKASMLSMILRRLIVNLV